jgi:hypothetical protein
MAFLQCLIQRPAREETLTGAITTFGIVVGMALLICYRLMTRMPKRHVVKGASADRSGAAGGADVGDGGGHHFAWSAGENSASGDSGQATAGAV